MFVKFLEIKRGHYRFEPTIITEEGASLQEVMLTRAYRDFFQATIREHSDNYLWSHRRWKFDYTAELKKGG